MAVLQACLRGGLGRPGEQSGQSLDFGLPETLFQAGPEEEPYTGKAAAVC